MQLGSVDSMTILILVCFIPQIVPLTSINMQRPGKDLRRMKYDYRSVSDRVGPVLEAISNNGLSDEAVAQQEEKFKIVTCMSTACSRKRQSLGMDNLCTFGAMYARASGSRVQVEEGPCIGSCKKAPCVSIEHEDFFGSVALEGMTVDEFASDTYVQEAPRLVSIFICIILSFATTSSNAITS
jgi:hypothetical protein